MHTLYNVAVSQVFTHGGSWNGGRNNKLGEVLDPLAGTPAWRTLANLGTMSIRTSDSDGVFRSDNHPWLFGWSDNEGALLFYLSSCATR